MLAWIFLLGLKTKNLIIEYTFEWLEFDQLKNKYFYPTFLKKEIYNLPNEFTIRTEL